MKIIDLLNKIANGEEDDLITEFEFDKQVWNFKGLNDSEFCLDGWLLNQNITITKHKEILEEEKKIPEKLTDILRVDDLIPPVDENMYKIWTQTIKNQNKINEIIDYLKSKGE